MLPGLHANASSSVTTLPDNAYEIAKMLLNHSKRITQGFPFNPQSGVLPFDMKLPKELESDQYTREQGTAVGKISPIFSFLPTSAQF